MVSYPLPSISRRVLKPKATPPDSDGPYIVIGIYLILFLSALLLSLLLFMCYDAILDSFVIRSSTGVITFKLIID